MYTVFVTVDVREDRLDEFLDGIHANAIASLRDEPGCVRFDVHRAVDQPTRLYFYEIYRDKEAFEIEHRGAAHYATWRAVVERCLVPGSMRNTYAEPSFPEDVPESPAARRSA